MTVRSNYMVDGAPLARAARHPPSGRSVPKGTLGILFAGLNCYHVPPTATGGTRARMQAMRRQVRRAVQLGRKVPSGSLPALRDADLIVTQEPATLQGNAPSFREFLAEHL